jgi:hypothetical protein
MSALPQKAHRLSALGCPLCAKSGQVQVMFDPVGEAIGYIKAGTLRPLVVT